MSKVQQVNKQLWSAYIISIEEFLCHIRIILFIMRIIKTYIANTLVRCDSIRRNLNNIIDFVKLLITVKSVTENVDHFEIFLNIIDLFDEKLQTLHHHILSNYHQNFIFKFSANDHVSDSNWDKFFIEIFFILFWSKEFLKVIYLVGQFNPAIGV